MKRFLTVAVIVALGIIATYLVYDYKRPIPQIISSAECVAIERLLQQHLKIGDSGDRIVEVAKEQSWEHHYEKRNNAYYYGIDIKKAGGVVVHVVIVTFQMDSNNRITSIAARDSYKGL